MQIVLYQNCRLTKAYNEVFQSSYLDGYLNSLTKYEYELPEGDEVYLSNRGRFNLDALYQGNFKCNYMKVVDEVNNITRYFFLDDFDIVNGIVVVDYTEDIWASYSKDINIVKGAVSNLRYGIGTDLKYLPNEYVSNEKLSFNSLESNTSGLYNIILVIQGYKLQQSGVITERHLANAIMIDDANYTIKDYSFNQAQITINTLIQYSSLPDKLHSRFIDGVTFVDYSYDIVSAYIFPKSMLNGLGITKQQLGQFCRTTGANIFATCQFINSGIYTKTAQLNSNFKRYAIGTLDNFVLTEENGTKLQLEYNYCFDNNNVKLNLKVGSSIIDITNSFKYDIPISVQSADVTQQQQIALSLNNQMLDINKRETIAKGVTSLVENTARGIMGGVLIGSGLSPIKGTSLAIEGVTGVANTAIDMAYSLEKNDLKNWYINYKAYKTSTAITTSSNLQFNLLYGVCEFIVVPDNENYVDELIEVVGYNTLKIVTNNSLIASKQENQDYNIVRFSSVWIYGNFPHSVQLVLEEILTKGFKIWFKSNV